MSESNETPSQASPSQETHATRREAELARSKTALAQRIAAELSRDLLSEAHEVAAHALARHGADAIGPILFYGSCQRAESAEGILDVYLLSKSNRAFHDAAIAAAEFCSSTPSATAASTFNSTYTT